jgi:DNA polymerase III epsilon subunit-like protein
MNIIVFDLETTDLLTCGQILNYSFVHLSDYNQPHLSRLDGNIELSPHQLPSVSAIMSTNIDISKHRMGLYDSEQAAVNKIHRYISNIVEDSNEPVTLVGHNIARFDLEFLRTSFIRNGLFPYFRKNLKYADTIFLTKKLLIFNEKIRNSIKSPISLKLSDLIVNFNLELGDRFHNSVDDVDHTIRLLKFLDDNGVNVNSKTYDNSIKVGNAVYRYEFVNGEIVSTPYLMISEDKSYSLFLNMNSYKELGRNAVKLVKKGFGEFYKDNTLEVNIEKIKECFNFIMENDEPFYNIETYFQTPVCDIEQHIYMLPLNDIQLLYSAIYNDNRNAMINCSDYCVKLFLRHLMQIGTNLDILHEYVNYRYNSSNFILSKWDKTHTHWKIEEEYNKCLDALSEKDPHPSLNALKDLYLFFIKKFDIKIST